MKTKIKLLTLIIFCLSATLTYSQDATNDATWEETIDFINKNKKYFLTYDGELKTIDFFIEDYKYLKIRQKNFNTKKEWISKGDLFLLFESVKYEHSPTHIYLRLSGNYFEDKYVNEERLTKNDRVVLSVEDKIIYPRIFKAFEHLVHLASKKREEDRKASGDKF